MVGNRDQLLERYRGLLARVGASVEDHPLFFARQDDGSTHLEFHPDGSVATVVTERGMVLEETRFDEADALLYLLVSDAVSVMAAHHELANRVEGTDFRRTIFAREIELMSRVSEAWGERKRLEIEDRLRLHPYVDAPLSSRRTRLRLLIGFGIVVLLVSLHGPVFAAFHRQNLLQREGISVDATVMDRSIVENRFVDIHRVTYRYEVEGKTFQRSETVDARIHDRATAGATIELRYLPTDPELAMIAGNDQATRLAWIWGIIDLLLVIAAWRIRSAARKDQGAAT